MSREKSHLKFKSSDNGRSKTWVLISHCDLLDVKKLKGTPDIVKLRHPRSNSGALFMFSRDDSVIQEVLSLSEKRSWFIDDSVRENGQLLFSTPVDPLFLILPYLKKSKEEKKIVPLEDLLVDDDFPEALRILNSFSAKSVHLLADKKGTEDLNAWMYNEEKTIKWLCKKTVKVAEIFKEKQINVGGCATSKNFIKCGLESSDSGKEYYLKYAHELVSEYLSDDLSSKLLSSIGLPEESPLKKGISKRRSSQMEERENDKKIKRVKEMEEVSKPSKSRNLSAKEKAAMKAASGSKCITSFFGRK